MLSNCYYCGTAPSGRVTYKARNSSIMTNGIDRIDPTKDYSIENVVSCCWICNRAKCDLTKTNFLEWVKRIYNYQMI